MRAEGTGLKFVRHACRIDAQDDIRQPGTGAIRRCVFQAGCPACYRKVANFQLDPFCLNAVKEMFSKAFPAQPG